MTRLTFTALCVALCCVARQASASPDTAMPDTDSASSDSAPSDKVSYQPSHMGIELGMRTSVIDHPGLDPYSDDNLIAQLAIALRAVPLHVNFPGGHFGIALNGEYDIGATSARARGQQSALVMHRLAGGAELYVDWWRLRIFARGMPGAIHLYGQLDDAGSLDGLEAHAWTWGVDATGGLRFRLATVGTDDDPRARFWLLAEAGYSFAGETEMIFAPEETDERARVGSVALPDIAPEGFVNRVALGVSF